MQTVTSRTRRWPSRRPARSALRRTDAARPSALALLATLLLAIALPTAAVALATAALLAPTLAHPPAAAAETGDDGPNWLPIKVDGSNPAIQLWCSWGNPGPASNPSFCSGYHPSPALDIGMPPGTPIYAAGSGTVAAIGTGCIPGNTSCNGAAGNYVAIGHPNGHYSRYLHLTSVTVNQGQAVKRGDLIGYSGYTGSVYPTSPQGAHLHFDVVGSLIQVNRIDPGPLSALQGGNVVTYPQVLGLSSWTQVPFGTVFRNDGYPEDEPPPPPPPVPGGTPPAAPANGAGFHPVVPFRALDSRTDTGGWSGPLRGGLPWGAPLSVAGANGVPPTASAVVMNVTVTGATLPGYLTVFPWGVAPPNAANLVFQPGQTVPNLVTVAVGFDGDVAFYASAGKVHVVADVVGWYDDGTGDGDLFHPLVPTRALDSRGDVGGWSATALGEGQTRDVAVAGVGGVPEAATGVVMNVTVTGATTPSYVQAFPAGAPQPVTANLVFANGQTVPNLVVAGVGAGGKVSLFNQLGSVDVVIDVVGWFEPGAGGGRFHPITPTRMVDDRAGIGGYTDPWGPDIWRAVQIGDGVTVPAAATGVVMNVTATGVTDATYLALYPDGAENPGTANVLAGPRQTVPNLVVVGLSGGVIRIYNQQGSVDVVGDVAGYYTG